MEGLAMIFKRFNLIALFLVAALGALTCCDMDMDGVPDDCPTVFNADQTDLDSDGTDDACESLKIAFTTTRDGNIFEIYTMNADGTDQTNVTNNPGRDSDPVFSPDGNKIAFVSDRDGNFDIYVMNADGTRQTNLTNDMYADSSPTFGLVGP